MNKEQQQLVEMAVKADTPQSRIKMALQVLMDEEEKTVQTPDKYMSVKETCEYLAGCSRVHLWKLTKRGLPSHRIGGRLGFKKGELDLWIAEQ